MDTIRVNKQEDCPSKDFEQGAPNGNCWGDGHYLCQQCKHYRKDFKEKGFQFVQDIVGAPQFVISVLK